MIIELELTLCLGLNKTGNAEQNLASLPKLLKMLPIKAVKDTELGFCRALLHVD